MAEPENPIRKMFRLHIDAPKTIGKIFQSGLDDQEIDVSTKHDKQAARVKVDVKMLGGTLEKTSEVIGKILRGFREESISFSPPSSTDDYTILKLALDQKTIVVHDSDM